MMSDYRIKTGLGDDDNEQQRSGTTTAPRKGNQCAFQLMNLLFSNKFASEFALLGNIATRESLDTGKAGNDQIFWERVHAALVTEPCQMRIMIVSNLQMMKSLQSRSTRLIQALLSSMTGKG